MIELKPKTDKILIFLVSIIITLFLIGLLIRNLVEGYYDINATGSLIITIVGILFVSPPLVLSITYLYTDLTKKIYVDDNKIIINNRGKSIIITKEDVMVSFYVKVDDLLSYRRYCFPWYKHIAIILKERKKVFITNLLCEPELIISTLKLNNKMICTPFPFLNPTLGSGILTSKEYEKKVLEFEKLFEEHTDTMLLEIIHGKKIYADYAQEAATRLLKRRIN